MSDQPFIMTKADIQSQAELCEQYMTRCKSILLFEAQFDRFKMRRDQYANVCETYGLCSIMLDSLYRLFDFDEDVPADAEYEVPKPFADALFIVLRGCLASAKKFKNLNLSMELH
jgi:hypothetical protein